MQKPIIIGHKNMATYHNSVIVIDETPKLPQEHRPIPDLNLRHVSKSFHSILYSIHGQAKK